MFLEWGFGGGNTAHTANWSVRKSSMVVKSSWSCDPTHLLSQWKLLVAQQNLAPRIWRVRAHFRDEKTKLQQRSWVIYPRSQWSLWKSQGQNHAFKLLFGALFRHHIYSWNHSGCLASDTVTSDWRYSHMGNSMPSLWRTNSLPTFWKTTSPANISWFWFWRWSLCNQMAMDWRKMLKGRRWEQ